MKKKRGGKEKDIVKKKIKSCLEWVTGICLNQEKKAKTSYNRLLKLYYST